MSLREAVEADRTKSGGMCPVRALIDGRVPRGSTNDTPLDPDDRQFLAEACAPGSPAVLSKVQRHLTGAGYKVGSTALQNHRRRGCGCP